MHTAIKKLYQTFGGGDTQDVFKKNRLFRKTTQNIGKEFKKKRIICKLLEHNLDKKWKKYIL